MRPEAAAGTAMAANMYRVGGEYRALGASGLGAGEVGRWSQEARLPAARGTASGAAWSRARTGTGTGSMGSEGAGIATRPGSETPGEAAGGPTALSGQRPGHRGRGVGLRKWFQRG